MAEGSHLFPFRTEKLSPPAPMVLPGRPGGRVGRRPICFVEAPEPTLRGFDACSGAPIPPPHPRDPERNGSPAARERTPRSSRGPGALHPTRALHPESVAVQRAMLAFLSRGAGHGPCVSWMERARLRAGSGDLGRGVSCGLYVS